MIVEGFVKELTDLLAIKDKYKESCQLIENLKKRQSVLMGALTDKEKQLDYYKRIAIDLGWKGNTDDNI
jgi:hypothetical protein